MMIAITAIANTLVAMIVLTLYFLPLSINAMVTAKKNNFPAVMITIQQFNSITAIFNNSNMDMSVLESRILHLMVIVSFHLLLLVQLIFHRQTPLIILFLDVI